MTHADYRQLSFTYYPYYKGPLGRSCSRCIKLLCKYCSEGFDVCCKKFGLLASQGTVTCRNRWDKFPLASFVAV